MTLVEWVRLMGGGTWGACVRTAVSSPTTLESTPLAAAPLGLVRSASAADAREATPRARPRNTKRIGSGFSDNLLFICQHPESVGSFELTKNWHTPGSIWPARRRGREQGQFM